MKCDLNYNYSLIPLLVLFLSGCLEKIEYCCLRLSYLYLSSMIYVALAWYRAGLQTLIWYAIRVNNANDYLTTEQIIEISPAPQRIRYADENC